MQYSFFFAIPSNHYSESGKDLFRTISLIRGLLRLCVTEMIKDNRDKAL